MNSRLVRLLGTLSVMAVLTAGLWLVRMDRPDDALPPDELTSGPPIRDFQLTTQSGDEFHSSSLDGQVWVASYFFTRCGSNCRELNTRLAGLQREYGPRGVRFVSISCDPNHDVPEELSRYANFMNADHRYWTFLTGNLTYIRRIGNDVIGQPVSERGHNAMITIFDRSGASRGVYDAIDADDLARGVQMIEDLLAEQEEPAHETDS